MERPTEVLQIDQWSSTGDFSEYSLTGFRAGDIILTGGDATASREIFGCSSFILSVEDGDYPGKGKVWLTDDPTTGKLKVWKANYDSS